MEKFHILQLLFTTLCFSNIPQSAAYKNSINFDYNFNFSQSPAKLSYLEAKKLRTEDLIERDGYPVEVHEVVTPDGFILTLHRIPHGAHEYEDKFNTKRAVLVYHGNFQSSADWIMSGVNGSLAYILADSGYDVWLANFRGNTYSDRHLHLYKTQRNYWDWTFHDMGKFDVPAVIDYILKIKQHKDLYYIGFSMGNTIFYAAMDINPYYNEKIRLSISLGPSSFAHNWVTPFGFFSPSVVIQEFFTKLLGDPVIRPDFWINLLRKVSPLFCRVRLFAKTICSDIMFLIFGFDRSQLDLRRLPEIFIHTPTPVSSKNLIHVLQMRNRKTFGQFDYGWKGNLHLYGQPTPPDYDLSKITSKHALIWGKNDWVADPVDVDLLAQRLPNLIYNQPVPYDKFNHLDFTYAKDGKYLVYNTIVDLISQN